MAEIKCVLKGETDGYKRERKKKKMRNIIKKAKRWKTATISAVAAL
jgi:hypothetical protein